MQKNTDRRRMCGVWILLPKGHCILYGLVFALYALVFYLSSAPRRVGRGCCRYAGFTESVPCLEKMATSIRNLSATRSTGDSLCFDSFRQCCLSSSSMTWPFMFAVLVGAVNTLGYKIRAWIWRVSISSDWSLYACWIQHIHACQGE